MISIEEALKLVVDSTYQGTIQTTALKDVTAHYLARDLNSEIDLPGFRNSAMDGYAFLHSDFEKGVKEFLVVGEIQAGDTKQYQLDEGQAFRIFTGAAVPLNCDLVIMQEQCERDLDRVRIMTDGANKQQNIRQQGEQVMAGSTALEAGTKLTPAAIGYLSSLGFTEVPAIQLPKIAVVSTGNELVRPGQALEYGQIYESNSAALMHALSTWGIETISHFQLEDNFEDTKSSLGELLRDFDYVLVSGGISVGDYDFVGKALNELGVSEVFYKVNQKPGKPLFFGKTEDCLVFALPGNPAAALTCLEIYVKSSLRVYLGAHEAKPNWVNLPIKESYAKKGDRGQFLKAKANHMGVEILEGQSSNMMHTYARANALAFIPASVNQVNAGDKIRTLLLH